MENNETQKEVGESEDTGEGDKPKTVDVLKQQSAYIKELENAAEERALEDAKKQLHGTLEGGKPSEKTKKTNSLRSF